MSVEQFAALPDSLLVREVRYQVRQKGFRVQEVLLVTTLLNPVAYPAEELAQKFRERWMIEGNFDHLKTTMGAAVLHCKSVEGVTKELWVFALVYNLIRQVMLVAAKRQEVDVGRISFIDASALVNKRSGRRLTMRIGSQPATRGQVRASGNQTADERIRPDEKAQGGAQARDDKQKSCSQLLSNAIRDNILNVKKSRMSPFLISASKQQNRS